MRGGRKGRRCLILESRREKRRPGPGIETTRPRGRESAENSPRIFRGRKQRGCSRRARSARNPPRIFRGHEATSARRRRRLRRCRRHRSEDGCPGKQCGHDAGGGVTIDTAQACSVVVAGGGPVGAATALSLAERGYAVTLVDRAHPQPGPSAFGMDIRNVALSPRSAALLRQIDSWPEQAATYRKMCVWEERGTSRLTFDVASAGRSELGWLVEVTPLLARLWQRLDEHSNITLVFGSVTDVATTNHGSLLPHP